MHPYPSYTYGYRVSFNAFSEVVFPDGLVIRRIEGPNGQANYIEMEREFTSSDKYFINLQENGVVYEDREIDGDELNEWLESAQ